MAPRNEQKEYLCFLSCCIVKCHSLLFLGTQLVFTLGESSRGLREDDSEREDMNYQERQLVADNLLVSEVGSAPTKPSNSLRLQDLPPNPVSSQDFLLIRQIRWRIEDYYEDNEAELLKFVVSLFLYSQMFHPQRKTYVLSLHNQKAANDYTYLYILSILVI